MRDFSSSSSALAHPRKNDPTSFSSENPDDPTSQPPGIKASCHLLQMILNGVCPPLEQKVGMAKQPNGNALPLLPTVAHRHGDATARMTNHQITNENWSTWHGDLVGHLPFTLTGRGARSYSF